MIAILELFPTLEFAFVLVCVLGLAAVVLLLKRATDPPPETEAASLDASIQRQIGAEAWPPPEPAASSPGAERRRDPRRIGKPVAVRVIDPASSRHFDTAYIVDRSAGGARIAVPAPVAVGTAVQIRAVDAAGAVPWVIAVVRHCLKVEEHWEVGCEFDGTPPRGAMETFG